MKDSQVVTVCGSCYRASCWQGKFFCEDYKTAGTTTKTVRKLRELDLEHPDHWKYDA